MICSSIATALLHVLVARSSTGSTWLVLRQSLRLTVVSRGCIDGVDERRQTLRFLDLSRMESFVHPDRERICGLRPA